MVGADVYALVLSIVVSASAGGGIVSIVMIGSVLMLMLAGMVNGSGSHFCCTVLP